MTYVLLHLSDPVSFDAPSKRTAQMVAVLLGEGLRDLVDGAADVDDEVILPAFMELGLDPAELTGVSEPELWYEEHRLELLEALRTVVPGTTRDRALGRAPKRDSSPTCARADRLVAQIARGIAA